MGVNKDTIIWRCSVDLQTHCQIHSWAWRSRYAKSPYILHLSNQYGLTTCPTCTSPWRTQAFFNLQENLFSQPTSYDNGEKMHKMTHASLNQMHCVGNLLKRNLLKQLMAFWRQQSETEQGTWGEGMWWGERGVRRRRRQSRRRLGDQDWAREEVNWTSASDPKRETKHRE